MSKYVRIQSRTRTPAAGRPAERALGIALGADAGKVAVSTKVGRIIDAVDTVVVGARSPAEAAQNWSHLHRELPEELWPALDEALRDATSQRRQIFVLETKAL